MIPVIEQEYRGPYLSGSQIDQPHVPSVPVDPSITARTETVTMIWHYGRPPQAVLTEAEAPALAKIWDNDSDAIFDTM
jgi:hypothetical protein